MRVIKKFIISFEHGQAGSCLWGMLREKYGKFMPSHAHSLFARQNRYKPRNKKII